MNDDVERFVLSTVIRGTAPGEPHGRLVLVEPDTGRASTLVVWDPPVPTEAGGGARGLRGLAVHADRLWVVSFGALLEIDRSLGLVAVHGHPLLADAHQLCAWGDQLLIASTGFDSVLAFDPASRRWTWGLLIRGNAEDPTVRTFDPDGADLPRAADTTHLNQVHVADGVIWVTGLRLPYLMRIGDGRVEAVAALPLGTHDARPFRGGVLYHDTAADQLAWDTGEVRRAIPVPRADPATLRHLGEGGTRPAFARGMCLTRDGLVLGGSSPGAVHRYDLDVGRVRDTLGFSDDAREAVHGLAPWPWDPVDGPPRSALRGW